MSAPHSTPLISVVLPTLNRSALLPRAIGSVLAQTFGDLELIVVDDGSDEDIAAVVARFADPRARVIRHPVRRGAPAARNTGLNAAVGEYVAFQDSDDEWLLHKLERQVAALRSASPDIGLAICGMLRVLADGNLWSYPEPRFIEDFGHDPLNAVRHHPMAFTQTWLARRSVLLELGGFQENLKIWDDWELLLRIASRHRIQLNPELLALSYITAGSVSSDAPARVTDLQRIQAAHAQNGGPRLQARLHYLSARYRCINNDKRGAWSELRLALGIQPMSAKAWVLGLLMLVPGPIAMRTLTRAS
ncbi:MAG: glycosyltransferase [Pseudomonadota bacterium]|nr:glycosyltransferase [Pseudomonadota bacterium]